MKIINLMKIFLLLEVIALFIPVSASSFKDVDTQNKINTVQDFAERLKNRISDIITDPVKSETRKTRALRNIFFEVVDIHTIAKFSLGKYFRNLRDEEQKKQFYRVFSNYMANSFVKSAKKFSDARFNIDSITKSEAQEGIYTVKIEVSLNNKKQIADNSSVIIMQYKIIDKNTSDSKVYSNNKPLLLDQQNSFKIYDIVIDNFSMASTERDEINAIMENQASGDIDNLIKIINEKNIQLQQEPNADETNAQQQNQQQSYQSY